MELTENGSNAYTTSGDACVDLFSKVNRDMSVSEITDLFQKAYHQEPETAMKLLYHLRDPRNGKGEKKLSLHVFRYILEKYNSFDVYNMFLDMLEKGYACWKDVKKLSVGADKDTTTLLCKLFSHQLRKDLYSDGKISLAAKWAPSEGKAFGYLVNEVAKGLGLNKKQYRKMLSKLRKDIGILETKLVEKDYDSIDYKSVPSRAMHIHQKLFEKVGGEKFEQYLEDLKSGKTKVNATGMHPHELVKKPAEPISVSQWDTLVKKVHENGNILSSLSICDTSGSMSGGDPSPMSVAMALSIFLSDLNTLSNLPFGGNILTFNSTPEWVRFEKEDTLEDKRDKLQNSNWGNNTDLMKVFELILSEAKRWNVKQSDMPVNLFIFSDMQFDQACPAFTQTHFELIKQKYENAGYNLPNIVFWNLRATEVSVTAKSTDKNVAMLSGYSHTLFNYVVSNKEFTPRSVMDDALKCYTPVEINLKK